MRPLLFAVGSSRHAEPHRMRQNDKRLKTVSGIWRTPVMT